MKQATVLREMKKAGKTITRQSKNMNWVKLDDTSSLFWITSDGNATCLSVEGNGWSSSVRSVQHLRNTLQV